MATLAAPRAKLNGRSPLLQARKHWARANEIGMDAAEPLTRADKEERAYCGHLTIGALLSHVEALELRVRELEGR